MNRTVLALSVARLGDAIGNSILFIALPLYVAALPAPAFHVPETMRVGFLISLYGLVNSGVQPVSGALIDRVGRRKPFILAGLVIMAAGTLAFILATRFLDLLVLRALQGVGVALTIPGSMALMASVTKRETRGSAMGVYTTTRMIGFGLGPILGGWIQDSYGMTATFLCGGAFLVVAIVLVQLWVHDPPAATPAKGAPRPVFRLFDRSLYSAGILGAGVATFIMAMAFTLMTTLEKQFNTRLHQTAFGFGLAFSALMISRLAFQVPLGALSDRIGRKPLIIGGLALLAPSTAALGIVTSTLQLSGARVAQGLASAAVAAPAFAVAGDLARAGGEGRQMSVLTMGFGLGLALGPLLAGVLAVWFFELPFLVGGALCLVGAWVVFRYVPETVHRDQGARA